MISSFLATVLNNITFWNFLTIFVIRILHFVIRRWWLNLPPGPIGFPIVGSIPYLESHAEKTFASWIKNYGPVMLVDIGSTRSVVLNSYEAIEQAFIRRGYAFAGRYNTFFSKMASEDKGIIFLDDKDKWKVQRPFGLKALFGSGLHGISIEDRILYEAEQLCSVIQQKNGKPFILESDLMYHIANVVSDILVHERCSDHEDLKKLVRNSVDGFREDSLAYTLLAVLPWSRFIPFLMQKSLKRMREGISFGNVLMNGLIKEHEHRLDPKHARDMIDLFLIEHQQNAYSFEDLTQLRFYLKDLFVAGSETTTSTIRWILFYLIKHPDIQQKVHKEIEQVLGAGGKVKLSTELPYTKAVIQEGFRIQPAAPLSVPRKTTQDVNVMGYHIPKNTQVIPNIYAVHHNPVHFPEPEKFSPERHLDENEKFVKLNRIIPFSIGSRNCLGENFARSEVFLFIVTILQKFEALPNPDYPIPPMKGIAGIINSAPHYPIIMKEK